MSPALLATDTDGALRQRYGRLAGTIGTDGLAEANELLVYRRPPRAQVIQTQLTSIGHAASRLQARAGDRVVEIRRPRCAARAARSWRPTAD